MLLWIGQAVSQPVAPVKAQAEIALCAPCHLNPALHPQYRDSTGQLHRLFIDAEQFTASIHHRKGQTSCTSCHKGEFSQFPHTVAALPKCLDCHQNFKGEYDAISSAAKNSVHFAVKGFDCATCHSPHSMVPSREMSLSQKNEACITCHEPANDPTAISLAKRHNWHPQAALHLDKMACIACHTKPEGDDFSFRHNILPKDQAESDCFACHSADNKMAHYVGSFGGGKPQVVAEEELISAYYISGATRHPLIDTGGAALLAFAFAGLLIHGIIRAFKGGNR